MADVDSRFRCVFDGTTEEGLQILIEERVNATGALPRIRTGMHCLEEVFISDHGIYADGTRWYIYDSPWHYSVREGYQAVTMRPVRKSKRRRAMATLEVPLHGPARIHYTTKMDIIHSVRRAELP